MFYLLRRIAPVIKQLLIGILMFILHITPAHTQFLSSFQNPTHLTDFPQNTVQAIYQDSKDYIWIGTESGLNKYDGKRIINYKLGLNDNFTLIGKKINNITEDNDHNLWVATNNGLTLFSPSGTPQRNKVLISVATTINNSLVSKKLECIKLLTNKKMVLGSRSGMYVYNSQQGVIKPVPLIFNTTNQAEPFVVDIQEDIHNNIIVITSMHGVYIVDTGLHVVRHIPIESFKGIGDFSIYKSIYLPDDKLFIASSQGLFTINLKTNQLPKKINDQQELPLSTLQFNCLAYDPFKILVLAGTNRTGVITFDTAGNMLDHLVDNKTSKKLQSNNIFSLLADKRGLGYWIGNGKGLAKFFYEEDRFASSVVNDDEGSPMRIYPIYTENNTDILIGTDRFLIKYNSKTKQLQKIKDENKMETRYNYIYKVDLNFYIFCTKYGVYYADNFTHPRLKRISNKYPELKFMDSSTVFSALKINDFQLMFGTKGYGLVRWNIKTKKADKFIPIKNDSTSISSTTINYLTKSPKGDIIVCTDNGICFFDNITSKFRRILMPGKNGLNYPQVNAALSEQGILWIGTYGGGLNKYTISTGNIEYITDREGLPSNDIYAIYRGSPDHLWMSTNQGIVLYNTKTNKIRNYDKADGLISNEFNRNSSFKCGDTLYFGGISGINYFNYKIIHGNTLPPVADIPRIALLKSGKEEILFPDSLGRLKLDYNENTLKFYLSSPFYINPNKTTFHYRVLPNETSWISNGTNNELVLSQLPPGKHTIELKTINSAGIESNNIKRIYIRITPPWYETTWFRIFLFIFLSSIIYGYNKLRINQFKKEEKIRNQLAIDLHDDLGSTLNSVKVYSNLAIMEKENSNYLIKLKESTQEAISGVRDLIWVLDDKKDSISDLIVRIENFARPLCEANHINFEEEIEKELYDYKLGKEEKRNLYMIVKEFINNSIKYANCNNIFLEVKLKEKKLSLTIKDDGVGFEREQVREGNGLHNIANRIKYIRYTHSIVTSPGYGTILNLKKN